MKKIDIFIASSIVEFNKERERFTLVMGRLHDYLYEHNICNLNLLRCEDYETNILKKGVGTQDLLNDQIKESEICLFFFGYKIGSVSKEELNIAYDNYLLTKKSKPFVFFMKNINTLETTIFKEELDSKNIKYIDIDFFDEIIIRTIFYLNHIYNFNLDFKMYKDKLWVEDEYIMDNISTSIKIDVIHDKEQENKVVSIDDSSKIKLYSLMDNIYNKGE